MQKLLLLLIAISVFSVSCALPGPDPEPYPEQYVGPSEGVSPGVGPYNDGRMKTRLVDSIRDRSFATEIWFPADTWLFPTELDPSDAPYPLALFVHGWAGNAGNGAHICETLASYGFIVLAATLPDSAMPDYQQLVADIDFYIDTMMAYNADPDSPFYQMIDEETIVTIGHSLGGRTVFDHALSDPRVDAVIGLAPAGGLDLSRFAGLSAPKMLIWGTSDLYVDREMAKPYFDSSPEPRYAVEIAGGNHSGFLNNAVEIEPDDIDPAEQKRISLLYVTTMLLKHIKGWNSYEEARGEEFEPGTEVTFDYILGADYAAEKETKVTIFTE